MTTADEKPVYESDVQDDIHAMLDAEVVTRPNEVHRLRARLEMLGDEADVALTIECESPEGAWCRVTCDEGCEEYGPDHPHPLVSTDGYCNAVEWITSGESLHISYSGDGSYPLHDGMEIEVVWEGDYYSWRVPAANDGSHAHG